LKKLEWKTNSEKKFIMRLIFQSFLQHHCNDFITWT
jgi:hypothetical protein